MQPPPSVPPIRVDHVVVATDLSPTSLQALPYAAGFARPFGARVTLLHVDELESWPTRPSRELNDYLERVAETRRKRLEDARQTLARYGARAQVEVLSSASPGEAILEWATDANADLLVVMRRSASEDRTLFIGSTSERVMRGASVPVLVVHEHVQGAAPPPDHAVDYRKIVTSTDFSRDSRRGLDAALALADRLDAQVELVHVLQKPTLVPAMPGEPPLFLPHDTTDEFRAYYEAELGKLSEQLGTDRLVHTLRVGGNIGVTLTEAASEGDADLIVIPSHGKGALRTALFGSTARRVVKLARVPVLVLPGAWLARHFPHDTPA